MDESLQAVNDVVIGGTAWRALPVGHALVAAQAFSNASYTRWNRWFKSTNVTKGSL